ncbi:MAG: NAD(P)-binding protein [Pseudomonadota bacterium]
MSTDAPSPVSAGRQTSAGRIEGGIDAVVIGAGPNGLAAAASLARAGARTVLLGATADIGGDGRRREIAPGVVVNDGEHLVSHLDATLISELGLYKHGVEYAARRLDTTYFFDDEPTITLSGDPTQGFQSPDVAALPHAAAFQRFFDEMIRGAGLLAPALAGPRFGGKGATLDEIIERADDEMRPRLMRYASASVDAVLEPVFDGGAFRDLLTAEATFRQGAGPHEPFSFLGLIKRFSGESAGLQGAVAYPVGGPAAVVDALRRVVQNARVDIRAPVKVRDIIIEYDKVAGVELAGGGQIRTSIVVYAESVQSLLSNALGAEDVDIEYQRRVARPAGAIASAQALIKLTKAPSAGDEASALANRLVYAPPAAALRKSFNDARAGAVPEKLAVEAIFPGAIERAGADDNDDIAPVLSAIAHPLPFDPAPSQETMDAVEKAVFDNLELIAPGLAKHIDVAEIRFAAGAGGVFGAPSPAVKDEKDAKSVLLTAAPRGPAPANVFDQWARANAAATASDVDGLFFCGPEAEIGVGLSCTAGRAAAAAALRYGRKKGRVS